MIGLPFASALAAAVLSTSFLSGIFGMTGGMILMGILLVMMPLAAAMVLHGLTQMASNGWRAWLWRGHIKWPIVGYYAAGALLAAVLFVGVRFAPSKPVALIALGVTSLVGLLLPRQFGLDAGRRWHAFGAGAICTALQLLAGVSGPVLDVFFVGSKLDRKDTIATKAAIQLLGHFLKVVYFAPLLVGGDEAIAPMAAVLAVTLAVVGTQLSWRVLDAISDAQFRVWTRRLIAAIAAVYLIQGLVLLVDGHRAAEAVAAPPITSVALEP